VYTHDDSSDATQNRQDRADKVHTNTIPSVNTYAHKTQDTRGHTYWTETQCIPTDWCYKQKDDYWAGDSQANTY